MDKFRNVNGRQLLKFTEMNLSKFGISNEGLLNSDGCGIAFE